MDWALQVSRSIRSGDWTWKRLPAWREGATCKWRAPPPNESLQLMERASVPGGVHGSVRPAPQLNSGVSRHKSVYRPLSLAHRGRTEYV
jgi:hypothetical protein